MSLMTYEDPQDDDRQYRLEDDDGGGFDGGGDDGGDDGGGDDGGDDSDDQPDDGDQDDDQQDDDQQDDDDQTDDDQDGDADGGDDAGGDDNNDGDNNNDQNDDEYYDEVNDSFSDSDDLVELDDDTAPPAEAFPNATEDDFKEDDGNWTETDYDDSAKNLFGNHEYFGDTQATQLAAQGYQEFADPGFMRGMDQIVPGAGQTINLYQQDGRLHAFGFIEAAALSLLMARYTGIDFSHMDVSVPQKGDIAPPQPLPPALAAVVPKDAVDLRKFATPIGDQGQTSRCSAFAWTHATELVTNMKTGSSPRLSPSFTMLEFQRMQGDAKDYQYAYSGGDGTTGGTDPGRLLTEQGTCRQELWPDTSEVPVTSERVLTTDAAKHVLPATPLPISLEDARKVLSAGCPVHISINTGQGFSDIGRDGMFNAAESPSGQHGRHAMLMVGYTGNFYIVKNSWGADWGDQGYCYIPKKVLEASDPELIAVLVKKDEEPT
jgi:Papain family cysteine protease